MVQSIIVQGFASKMKSSLLLGVVLFISLFSGATVQAGDMAAGEKVFRKCSACHVVAKEQHRTGPHLVGLFGRAAATADGYKKHNNYVYVIYINSI